ncbi:hypothetical protein [Spirosoma spitsbergense]|uniref:hypothetical protein n=1 Tax=Spirosoma spitsbergense TaxID=431554 RepID=UPI000369CD15|nr:hypothetical protein [Spirosoma spitsbergense]
MNQALSPPVEETEGPVWIDPVGVDLVVSYVKDQLATLDWLQHTLGRIKPQMVNGKLEPWIQRKADGGEYYRAYPNDTLKSFSCLYAHDDEQYVNHLFIKRTLSVIVWVNLAKLPLPARSMEQLKQDVRNQLRELDCVVELGRSFDQTVQGSTAIYPGFDVSGLEERYLTYPYWGFRVETTIYFADLCS